MRSYKPYFVKVPDIMTDDIVNIGTDHICRQNISSRVHVVFHPIEALFDCYFDSRGCDDDRVEEAYGKVCRALVDVNPFQIEEIMGAVAELYIIRDGRLFKISSTSLPIGITREIASEEIKFSLKENDLIIMISDGVSQSFEDGVWLLSMLSDEIKPDAPLTTIARSILEKAKVKNERSDDMTVIALRIGKAE